MLPLKLGSDFRDEMIVTATVISITVFGSFFLLSQFTQLNNEVPAKPQILGDRDETATKETDQAQIAQATTDTPQPTATPTLSPSPSPTPTATPSPTPSTVEISYGSTQAFENSNYKIEFSNPKLAINSSRIFKMEVIIGNKNVSEGISNDLYGVLSRDGDIISSEAPLTLSDKQLIMPEQQLSFVASLSLPENMLLEEVKYIPRPELIETTYNLDPTL